MLCENVFRPHCDRNATNAVPMFMGSVWMCARCSLETQGDATVPESEIRTGDYVRIAESGTCGIVTGVHGSEYVVEYFRDGESGIATLDRNALVSL